MKHIQAACLKKRKEQQPVRTSSNTHSYCYTDQDCTFEVYTGVGTCNFCSVKVWTKIGKPTLALAAASCCYEVANGQSFATLGTFQTVVSLQGEIP